MYNFFGYFLAVYLIVFGVLIGWLVYQFQLERQALKKIRFLNQNKEDL